MSEGNRSATLCVKLLQAQRSAYSSLLFNSSCRPPSPALLVVGRPSEPSMAGRHKAPSRGAIAGARGGCCLVLVLLSKLMSSQVYLARHQGGHEACCHRGLQPRACWCWHSMVAQLLEPECGASLVWFLIVSDISQQLLLCLALLCHGANELAELRAEPWHPLNFRNQAKCARRMRCCLLHRLKGLAYTSRTILHKFCFLAGCSKPSKLLPRQKKPSR